MFLYLANSSLGSAVVAWSRYEGSKDTVEPSDEKSPPYRSALHAMRDGWRVLQVSTQENHAPGNEFELGYLRTEVLLERMEEKQ